MVDYFDLERSIVAVAVGYQDRYMNTDVERYNRAIFRVVSVTSLYIAIKLRAPQRWNITAHAFAHLCQGAVTGNEINDMEIKILFALNWKVNPPCPMQYALSFLELIFNPSSSRMCRSLSRCGDSFDTLPSVRDLLPSSQDCSDDSRLTLDSSEVSQEDQDKCHKELREHIQELVSYQFEIALHGKGFYRTRASIIAIAAILNALEGVVYEGVGGTTFCRESIALVLDTCDVYRIVSEEELEPVRSMLLSSVVSSTDDSDRRQEGTVETAAATGESRCSSPPPRNDVTPPVSSSPTQVSIAKLFWSPSKMCEQVLTPQNVLSKLLAFR